MLWWHISYLVMESVQSCWFRSCRVRPGKKPDPLRCPGPHCLYPRHHHCSPAWTTRTLHLTHPRANWKYCYNSVTMYSRELIDYNFLYFSWPKCFMYHCCGKAVCHCLQTKQRTINQYQLKFKNVCMMFRNPFRWFVYELTKQMSALHIIFKCSSLHVCTWEVLLTRSRNPINPPET